MIISFRVLLLTFISCLTVLVPNIRAEDSRSTLYRRRSNWLLQSGQDDVLCGNGFCGDGSRTECVHACSVHPQCESVNFRSSDGHCRRHETHVLQWGQTVVADDRWDNYSPHGTDVRDGDWILVFRAQSDIDNTTTGKLMTTWNDNTTYSDDDLCQLSPHCFAHIKASCPSFYRTRWMDTWPSDVIDEVRLSLYTGGQPVREMVFNGTGSSRDDWFSHDRLLSSPWTDLAPATPLYFSLWGERHRRFYVSNSTFKSCTHYGWLIVLSQPGNMCAFDKINTQIENPPGVITWVVPQFLYATGTNLTNFKDNVYGKAEVMAIFIKLK